MRKKNKKLTSHQKDATELAHGLYPEYLPFLEHPNPFLAYADSIKGTPEERRRREDYENDPNS